VLLGQDKYLTRQIKLAPADGALPSLWFALSDARLTHRLKQQRDLMLGLALAGGCAILFVGYMLLRNFSAPLTRLVSFIQAVGEGKFPDLNETRARDEVGYLTNQFSAMVRSLRDKQEEITRVHTQLEQQATTDPLTGFHNRRYLYDLYPKLWSEAQRQDKRLSVLLLDLDFFKRVNDAHGHLGGDHVLMHFAHILRSCCRLSDFVFRLGGEEFLVLTGGEMDGAQVLAEKIRVAVEQTPVTYQDNVIYITVSVGLAQAERTDTSGLSALLTRADSALYSAKQGGRNRVVSSVGRDAPGPRAMSSNLRK
jgi:diguanylate cyclase (GGDEF)-like protein